MNGTLTTKQGTVSFLFRRIGEIIFEVSSKQDAVKLMEYAVDAGAADVDVSDDGMQSTFSLNASFPFNALHFLSDSNPTFMIQFSPTPSSDHRPKFPCNFQGVVLAPDTFLLPPGPMGTQALSFSFADRGGRLD